MSVQPRKLRSGKTVYWITFSFEGKTIWERAGTDKRAAEALEKQRLREVESGTYRSEIRGRVSNRSWFDHYWTKRKNRTLDNDRQLIENHVLSQDGFARMPLAETRPVHILSVIEEIQRAGRLGAKSIAIVYGVMRGAYQRAVFEEKLSGNPCTLPKGTIKWKTAKANARKPYQREEARALVAPDVEWSQRVWNALAFYTGMRMGEVCGRRWRDWSREARPFTALSVHSQYDDQPLKTDDEEDTRPRTVPVHPELEAILSDWWAKGWELTHLRPPTPEDFIVPNRFAQPRARATAYDAFQRSLKSAGVPNRTVHATRHTFISVARSNGARKDVLEKVTHNASGEIIDTYTAFEWRALCEAVSRFSLDPIATAAELSVGPPGFEAGVTDGKTEKGGANGGNSEGPIGPGILAESGVTEAHFDAAQKRLLKLAEVDPEAAAPGLAVCRGVGLAVKMAEGDRSAEEELTALLAKEAVRVG